jgi:hypothetical protein
MIVRRFMCPEHGEQDTRIADGGLARCALCGQHMTPIAPALEVSSVSQCMCYRCPRHPDQMASFADGPDRPPRCLQCGKTLVPCRDHYPPGDPRRQKPPRGEQRPL